MNDFRAEPPALREAMLEAVRRVLDSGWYVLGREVEAFEREWAATCGARHAVGVGNGLDALEIALRAVGIGPGDEVLTTPMTAFATVLAIVRAGATPVFADIDPRTALLSIDSAGGCVTTKTRAVLLVHLYGLVHGMEAWTRFCAQYGIVLIEDCAQAHKAGSGGRMAGTFGAAGAYSFYPTKNLGAIGDAGMIVTNDDGVAQIAKRLRNYGQSDRYHHPEAGLNSRLDEIQAALLLERLKWLDEFGRRRSEIATAYHAGISSAWVRPLAPEQEAGSHAHYLFVVRCEQRDALQAHLSQHGVDPLIHYPVPAHLQPPAAGFARPQRGLGYSEHHAATCLSLPCHPQMRDSDVEQVIGVVNSFEAGV